MDDIVNKQQTDLKREGYAACLIALMYPPDMAALLAAQKYLYQKQRTVTAKNKYGRDVTLRFVPKDSSLPSYNRGELQYLHKIHGWTIVRLDTIGFSPEVLRAVADLIDSPYEATNE